MKHYIFEIYQGKDKGKQKFRWRFRDTEGTIYAKSEEPFISKLTCLRSIKRLQQNNKVKKGKAVFFVGKENLCYWRVKSNNGWTLAMSSKGHDSSVTASQIYRCFEDNASEATITESDM